MGAKGYGSKNSKLDHNVAAQRVYVFKRRLPIVTSSVMNRSNMLRNAAFANSRSSVVISPPMWGMRMHQATSSRSTSSALAIDLSASREPSFFPVSISER